MSCYHNALLEPQTGKRFEPGNGLQDAGSECGVWSGVRGNKRQGMQTEKLLKGRGNVRSKRRNKGISKERECEDMLGACKH